MNKRILELANQAGFYFDEYNEPTQRKVELFAELIVSECIDNLDFHGHDLAVSQLKWFKANRFGGKS